MKRHYTIIDSTTEIDEAVQDFMWDVKHMHTNKCVVSGSLGLWYCRREIAPRVFEDLHEAISACIEDSNYFKVEQQNSKIICTSWHHDGQNHFEIHLLNERGEAAHYKNENGYANINLLRPVYHQTLTDVIL